MCLFCICHRSLSVCTSIWTFRSVLTLEESLTGKWVTGSESYFLFQKCWETHMKRRRREERRNSTISPHETLETWPSNDFRNCWTGQYCWLMAEEVRRETIDLLLVVCSNALTCIGSLIVKSLKNTMNFTLKLVFFSSLQSLDFKL